MIEETVTNPSTDFDSEQCLLTLQNIRTQPPNNDPLLGVGGSGGEVIAWGPHDASAVRDV